MKVLFAASELTPIAKVGGLGDVAEGLPKALQKIGVNISIIIPRYGFLRTRGMERVARDIPVPLGTRVEHVSLFRTRLPGAPVPVFLIENNRYLSTGPGPYFERTAFVNTGREIKRFLFFSKAVAALLENRVLRADIVHANDWHCGALVALLARNNTDLYADQRGKGPRTSAYRPRQSAIPPKVVYTIHNLGNQGKWNTRDIDAWFLGHDEAPCFTRMDADYNFMTEGIRSADAVTTVSPTYAREILTPAYGGGLHRLLRRRARRLTGILNGIDYAFWNPARDTFIFRRFAPGETAGKFANKAGLVRALKLRSVEAPLVGLVARLTPQKGIDFVSGSAEFFIRAYGAQFAFLGQGSPEYEAALARLARRYPEHVSATIGFNERLAHQIYAGSDLFLMPSRFEPSGLGQMIAMRYGTIPVVRRTGGLQDTVIHGKTGFVFRAPSASSFARALQGALRCYRDTPDRFAAIRANCFRENFDFAHAARAYRELYRNLLAER